ncbi:MAG: 1-phosphofructokinase family hexose kinase, partial [Thermotogaceae bacterium]|nr:1-phosphofructokinase family hexose kinase [Thermotogaceae bacterium]
MKVLTVTFNPALDREIILDNFQVNKLHRIPSLNHMELSPGGKGINVSLALANFGVPSVTMGFLGGYIG